MFVTIDLPAQSLPSFKTLCRDQGIEINRIQEVGPAGGNPCVDIAVHSRAAMEALARFYWG
jgi:hypothetical protein